VDAGGFQRWGKERRRHDQLLWELGNGGVLRDCLSFLLDWNPQVENVPELSGGGSVR
jgi:hypothetical protein